MADYMKEVVLFRLNEGVEESAFLEAAQATFDLLQGYEGYINRDLTVSEDGLWIDVVTWTTMEAALKAAEKFMQSEIGLAFGSLIDAERAQMYHAHTRITTTV